MTKITARATAVVLLAILAVSGPSAQTSEPDRTVSEAQYEEWKAELSNWGRWGADDEIGALNLVTPAKRLQAVALVADGSTVSLAGDTNTVEAVDNPYPYEHEMIGISSDRLAVRYHGISHTHLDALAHVNDDGVFYNGYAPDAAAVAGSGHAKNSIHNLKSGIVTRGVLIDIPRLKGVPYLEPGTPIYVEDLEAWEAQAGVRVSAGDALFVRTGVWARRAAEGPWLRGRSPGGRLGRVAPVGHPVAEAAGYRADGQRPPDLRGPVGAAGGGARLRAALPRRAYVRQLRPRSARRGGCRAQPLGVYADGRAAADPRRDRLAAQPDRDVLSGTDLSAKTPVEGCVTRARATPALARTPRGG